MSNLDCDTLTSLSISVSPNSGEVDVANALFESNSGSFDINSILLNDTIGSSSISFSGGLFNFNSSLIVDSLTYSEIYVQSIDVNSGLVLGNFILINTSNGISINVSSPADSNNFTSGNTSSITFDNIFHNPLAPSVIFTTTLISDLEMSIINFLI